MPLYTFTAISLSCPGTRYSVTSNTCGTLSDESRPTCMPFMNTVVSMCGRSRWSRTRRFFHSFGTLTVREYHALPT